MPLADLLEGNAANRELFNCELRSGQRTPKLTRATTGG